MTTLNIELLRASFEKVKPHATRVSDRFYENLFQKNPEVKQLFLKADFSAQKMKLVGSLVYIFDHLDKPTKLEPYLLNMGSRHSYYGTQEEHYGAVGEALLSTLSEVLGPEFTPEIKAQWVIAFGVIAETMQKGQKGALGKRAA